MKKIIFPLLVAIGASTLTMAQQAYVSPDFKQATANHKLVAVLPFKTRISYKTQNRYFDYQANKEKEIDLSQITQSEMYTFLLNRSDKNTVDFQNIEKTNVLLRKAGMIDSLDHFIREDIARVLGVDAVVTGKYEIEHINTIPHQKPAEEAAANVPTAYLSGSAVTTVALNNGNGALLWRYNISVNDYTTISTINMVDRLMEKASKSFPYTKK